MSKIKYYNFSEMFQRLSKMDSPFFTRKLNIALLSRLVAYHIVIKTPPVFYKSVTCHISLIWVFHICIEQLNKYRFMVMSEFSYKTWADIFPKQLQIVKIGYSTLLSFKHFPVFSRGIFQRWAKAMFFSCDALIENSTNLI